MPVLDFSQLTALYRTGDQHVPGAAMRNLDAASLSARLPQIMRPLSRGVPERRVPLTDRPRPPPDMTRGSGSDGPAGGGGGGGKPDLAESGAPPKAPVVAASVAKLPDGWAALCLAREDAVERLANLALRLQSYTRSAGTAIPRSVRDRVAEELGVLRHATLELVEAVVRWQAEARAREQLRMREKREAAARRSALRREAATRGPPVGSEEALRAPPRKPPSKVAFKLEGAQPPVVPHPPPPRGETPPTGVVAAARSSAANMRAQMAVMDFSDLRPDLVKEIAVRSGRARRDNLFTTYALGVATGPPPAARQAVHIYRTGLDYLLKVRVRVKVRVRDRIRVRVRP